MVFGNPVVFPQLRQKGFVISTSVSQTATTSAVTYTITPPSNYIYNGDTIFGQLNLQVLLPPSTPDLGIQFTISYTGWANVLALVQGKFFAAGFSIGATPQTQDVTTRSGAGSLSFFLSGSSITNPQPLPPSSITVTANLGNPQGGRKAYLNDYTGLGKSNYGLWRPSQGTWYVDSVIQPEQIVQWGLPGDIPVPGDYDGDGITDYAVWRPSNATWYVILSSTGQGIVTQWGLPGDFPIAAGDYDGDGKTDYAVWRPSEGTWYVKLSSTGAELVEQFGLPGDVPLTGNFDGGGKTDFVIWRPSDALWFVYSGTTGAAPAREWGLPGDIPVPGDFDGDGKTDYAVWRPSEGKWYVTLSSTGEEVITQWGLPGDIPLAGDFDGDGKADYAIWRPSEGNWYILYSSTGQQVIQQWGLPGDMPNGQTLTSVAEN